MDPRACAGCLLGTAVGDSIGLPYEGLGPRRARRLLPGPLRQRLVFGRGMVSDDTEHACFTARALLLAGDDADAFARRLAASLRWWFAGLPAGIGLATLRAVIKSCVGFPPSASGVFSAGNGPAMRSPIIGVVHGGDGARLKAFVRASTRLTHTDPKAFHGALALALAARCSAEGDADAGRYLTRLQALLAGEGGEEMLALARRAADSAARAESLPGFAAAIASRGGISGYMLHTAPCVLQAWFHHGHRIEAGLSDVVGAGGDTDTAGAIYGAIAGAGCGPEGIPEAWRRGIVEWPRGVAWIEQLGRALGAGDRSALPGYFVPGVPLRNALFMAIVLAHGFRRLAPPY